MRAILTSFCTLSLSILAFAQPPAEKRDEFLEREFESYRLKPTDGPWLVYVASFMGEKSRGYAQDLANELRTKHKLNAFVFDRFQEERQSRDKQLAEWHKQYGEDAKVGKYRIQDEYAVVVGNFKDIDTARAAAEKIKQLPNPKDVPVSHAVIARVKTERTKTGLTRTPLAENKGEMSMFHGAFPTPNPLRPKDLTKVKENAANDAAWVELNGAEQYSLLKCKQPYTLAVKTFHGSSVVQEAAKPSIFAGNRPKTGGTAGPAPGSKSSLDLAAKEASRLANVLRDGGKGYEAYVLHKKDSSVVTVGGFSGPNDPDLRKLQTQLSGKTLGNVTLMPNPEPMPVPKP